MIPFPEYLLWIGATLLAGYVAALSWGLGVARHFPLLTSYLVLSLFAGLARWVTFARWGLVSELYMDLYYGSDLVLAVAVYLVILELQRPLLPAQFCRILTSFTTSRPPHRAFIWKCLSWPKSGFLSVWDLP